MVDSASIKKELVKRYGGSASNWKRYHCKFYTSEKHNLLELRKFELKGTSLFVAVAAIIERPIRLEYEVLQTKDQVSVFQGEPASGKRFAITAPDFV
jgi:hypothetical protein